MRSVLLVSKPVVPPWNDSSKNLVRDLALGIEGVRLHVMGTGAAPFERPNVIWEPVYRSGGDHAPGLAQNARALRRLARPDRGIGIYHFFFAPNPLTSTILRRLMRFKSQRTVHTVCSVPRELDGAARLLFADRVVAVSEATAEALRRVGVRRVRCIHPCIDPDRLVFEGPNPLARELALGEAPAVLYAGDLEIPGVAGLLVATLARLREALPDALLVVAAREKTAAARAAREALERELRRAGVAQGARILGEVARMDQLLALASVAILPVPTLYRKMDIPLVLLEALARRIPVVVSDLPALRELVDHGCGETVAVGDAQALAGALAKLLADPARRRTLGERGREAVVRHFSIAAASRAYQALYAELDRA